MDRLLWFMHSHKLLISICAGLELLKMTYVIFSSCFSCTKRPKILLVGVLDLIFGVPGLTVIVIPIVFASVPRTFILHGENSESALLEEIASPLLVLSGFPTLTGILTVLVATTCKNYCFANMVMMVRSIIIVLWMGVIVVFTLFYINYYGHVDYSESEIYTYFFRYIHFFFGAPGTVAFAQVYFISVLVKFCNNDFKGMGAAESGSSIPSDRLEGRPLTETQHQSDTWIVGMGQGGPKVVLHYEGIEY